MLGLQARDMVTGFEGTIIGRTEWLTGCASVGLAPGVDKDGKEPDVSWFDETRVEILNAGRIEPLPPLPKRLGLETVARTVATSPAGGPQETPQQAER